MPVLSGRLVFGQRRTYRGSHSATLNVPSLAFRLGRGKTFQDSVAQVAGVLTSVPSGDDGLKCSGYAYSLLGLFYLHYVPKGRHPLICYTNKHKLPFQIDDDDFNIVSWYKWYIVDGYVKTRLGAYGPNRYQVEIKVNGVALHIGQFNTLEEARIARLAAEDKYWKDER